MNGIAKSQNPFHTCVRNDNLFDCGGFDLDEKFGPREPCHSKQRACVPATGPNEALHDHTAVRQEALQIGRVNIQADHVRKAESCLVKHLLEIVDRAVELSAEVPGVDSFAFRVDGNLSSTVKDALAASHFVTLYKPQCILPF